MYVRSAPARGLQQDIFSFRNLCRSYLECRKNKRNTVNALKFELKSEENILQLERELRNKIYHPSRSILFAARKPKLREIFAADFRDRVVHHLLIDQLEPIWEPIFIHDSYACRLNKGTHAAAGRLQGFLRKATANNTIRAYYLQLDIKDFFISIDKELLFTIIQRKVNNPDILWLTKTVLFWDCTKSYWLKGDINILSKVPTNKSLFGKENLRGLPIGNLTSQFFANILLNELDQHVKHTLKAKYYLRYVDDFVLVSRDREELLRWKEDIKQFLHDKLKLKLHPRRQKLQPISNGIDFLGYVIRPNYILVRRRVVNNLKQKIKEFQHSCNRNSRKFKAIWMSYMGSFWHANSYRLVQGLIDR